jgi:hypothetical protein
MTTRDLLAGVFVVLTAAPMLGGAVIGAVVLLWRAADEVVKFGTGIDYSIADKRLQKAAGRSVRLGANSYRSAARRARLEKDAADHGIRIRGSFRWAAYYLVALAAGGAFLGTLAVVEYLEGVS